MRRKTLWTAALVMIGVLLFAGVAGAVTFKDVSGHWAQSAIEKLAGLGLIGGYSDGTFRPDQPVTRGAFITVLVKCMGLPPDTSGTSYFKDYAGHFSKPYINTAVKYRLLIPSEYPNGIKPDGYIKRSEVAALVVRALGKSPNNDISQFKDKSTVNSSMYKGYIKTACDEGLMYPYTSGEFKPFNNVSRAQMCDILVALMNRRGVVPAGTTGTGTGTTGTSTSNTTTPTSVPGASILKSVVIDGTRYDIAATPIYLKISLTDVRVYNLTTSGGYLQVNNMYNYALNTPAAFPDVVVYNNRYGISSLSVSGTNLIIKSSYTRLNTVVYNNMRYNAEYVKLYVLDGTAVQRLALSDAEIAGTDALRINDRTYSVLNTRMVLALGDQYARIKSITPGKEGTAIGLEESEPMLIDNLSISDIYQLFIDSKAANISSSTKLYFLINGERYNLNEIGIDSAGYVMVGSKVYSPAQVIMQMGDTYYNITEARIQDKKVILFCTTKKNFTPIKVNDQYRSADGVEIVYDGTIYPVTSVLVVSHDVLRIAGRQFSLDATVKARIDGTLKDIKHIDYDADLDMVELEVTDATTTITYTTNQPLKYVFYVNNSVIQDGVTADVLIYADGWVKFSNIIISSPSLFVYGSKSYSLIGARVRIKDTDYLVLDTAWRGRSQACEVYMEKY